MEPRVLIVEDESLIAMLLEDLLSELGYAVAATAPTVAAALAALDAHAIDLAIVDVNLGGTVSLPVADALVERGLPFLFTTGYGQMGLPEAYAAWPVLQKPFRKRDLEEALNALQASAPDGGRS